MSFAEKRVKFVGKEVVYFWQCLTVLHVMFKEYLFFLLLKTTGFIVGWEWKEDFRAVIYNTCDVHIL